MYETTGNQAQCNKASRVKYTVHDIYIWQGYDVYYLVWYYIVQILWKKNKIIFLPTDPPLKSRVGKGQTNTFLIVASLRKVRVPRDSCFIKAGIYRYHT